MEQLSYYFRLALFEYACKNYFKGDKALFYDLKKQYPYVYYELIKDNGNIILYMFKSRNLDIKWYSNRSVRLIRDWDGNFYFREAINDKRLEWNSKMFIT